MIDELRILAVRASPPEVAPGGSIYADAFVVDPLGGGRTISHRWSRCMPDPIEGVDSCGDPARLVLLSTNATIYPITVEPEFLDAIPSGDRPVGLDLFLVLTVSADGEETTAVKRVRVSTHDQPNRNPIVERFRVNEDPDNPTSLPAGTEVEVLARPTQDSRESYETPEGTILEEMRYSWWTTAGEFEEAVSFGGPQNATGKTKWISAAPATIWFVMRDPRGGVAWGQRDVTAP